MSGQSTRCVVASSNAGKLRELTRLLEPLGITPVAQSALGIEPAPEPHATFVENCLAKARHASAQCGLAALADDSGICVPALGGAPGVYSARYSARAGGEHSDSANNQHLIAELSRFAALNPGSDPYPAFYYCVLIWLRSADDPQPIIADARWHGRVVPDPVGDGGFGYDPYFFLPDSNCTAAQLSADHKNQISHRGMAMVKLREQLSGLTGGV